MIKKVFLACFYFFFLLFFFGCDKGNDDDNMQHDSYLRYFEGLTVEKDTLLRGQSTEISAHATGNKISYSWSASEGPIIGEGSKVIYLSSPCCWGEITITCEARAMNATESKSIKITVLQ